jgi:hypothetical protein
MGKLNEQIVDTQKAMWRRAKRAEEIYEEWRAIGGVCCPNCYSREYSELCDKQQRSAEWLGIQLVKRNDAGDLERAKSLAFNHNAHGILKFIEKRNRRSSSDSCRSRKSKSISN